MAAQTSWPSWLTQVTREDLAWHGVEILSEDTPLAAVLRLAGDLGVDIAQVEPCLTLLQGERCMLLGGSPLAVLAYSRRRRCFCASFDGGLEPGMEQLNDGRAGVWLTLLAGEVGALPASPSHWLIARLEGARLLSANDYLSGLARHYVERVLADRDTGQEDLPDSYDALVGRAIWLCATHVLR